MRYADPVAQAEIDRLRAVLHVANLDAWNLAARLLSCRKAGDEMVGEIEALEAEVVGLKDDALHNADQYRRVEDERNELRVEVARLRGQPQP